MLARYGRHALRHYIISHTEDVSDLLEVLVLQKEVGLMRGTLDAGAVSDLIVSPLFETIGDLREAPAITIIERLLAAGATVFLVDRATDRLATLCAELGDGLRSSCRVATSISCCPGSRDCTTSINNSNEKYLKESQHRLILWGGE